MFKRIKLALQGAFRHNRGRGQSKRSVNYTSSPLLASKTPPWRSKFIVALVGGAFLVLIGRALFVQVVGASFFVREGEKRIAHTMDLPATRGRITDRNGQLLATSVAAPSIWAIPKDMNADREQRRRLAKVLGLTLAELEDRLGDNVNFVWLRRQTDEAQWKAVQALGIKGVFETREYKRRYPEGEAAAHVVGFTDNEDRGLEGVELAFQRDLEGHDGNRAVVKDRLGRVIEDIGEQTDAVHGRDVQLSIDAKVQYFAYQRLKDAVTTHRAKSGSAVVIDVRTGEVLALANYPSYDPSLRKSMKGDKVRNRALTDTFEPGSTVKPFIAALAMQSGRVTPDTRIDTSQGSIVMTGLTVRDSKHHPSLTVSEIVQKSSNIGTVRMAMQMPPREMWEMYSQVGFGQKPALQFPGAVAGRLRPYKTWKPVEQATMSYGYGLSASLFQIARAYTVFARDGEVMPVTMLKQKQPAVGVRVIDAEHARAVRNMLEMVTTTDGTARQAVTMGFSVGGKTGTAFKHEGDGYSKDKFRSWFVGLAPIKNPRVVVAVMVDEPGTKQHTGGDVAAPVFSQVVQQTLRIMNVAPDVEVKPQYMTQATADGPTAPATPVGVVRPSVVLGSPPRGAN
jgi:cell division protein FtsI (penicillin-binding protein 3)